LNDLWNKLKDRLPSWPYLAGAIVVLIVGRLLDGVEIVEPLRQGTTALLSDLTVLDPWNVARVYYSNLTGCVANYSGMSVSVDCSGYERLGAGYGGSLYNPVYLLLHICVSLWLTLAWVWDNTGWGGRALAVLTLTAAGLWLANRKLNGEERDWDFEPGFVEFGWVILWTPIFAAVLGLGLQWLLIVLIWIFGQAIALIAWLVAVLAVPIAYARMAMGAVSDAKNIEKLAANFTPPSNGPPKG
jgi:hypothetical protein